MMRHRRHHVCSSRDAAGETAQRAVPQERDVGAVQGDDEALPVFAGDRGGAGQAAGQPPMGMDDVRIELCHRAPSRGHERGEQRGDNRRARRRAGACQQPTAIGEPLEPIGCVPKASDVDATHRLAPRRASVVWREYVHIDPGSRLKSRKVETSGVPPTTTTPTPVA